MLSFWDELEKIALNRLTKHLLSKAPGEVGTALKKLPAEMKSQQAYKLLGHRAADVAARMPDAAGHGAQHVFNVTRSAQQFTQGMPQQVQRRATLGALLHDVGREAEGTVKKRVGKAAFKASPDVWHSELGGRYSKNFLQSNKEIAQHVPGLDRGQLSGTIRAHDTDIHSVRPWTKQRLAQDPAASATYLADKAEGMGRMGAERTVQMAQKFKEPIPETMGVVGKNVQKYNSALQQPYVTPHQRTLLQPKIHEYQNLMGHYGQTGQLPGSVVPAQQFAKAATVHDVSRLIHPDMDKEDWRNMRRLATHSPSFKRDLVPALHSIPNEEERAQAIEAFGEHMPYVFGK
jgi:hypothetical protein